MSRRSFLQALGVGSAAMFVAACAPAAAPGGGGSPGQQATTVQFLAWGDTSDIPAWDALKAMYEERTPGVTVDVTPISDPNNNFYTRLQTMIAGGTPPDVSSFQGWEWQVYADRGVLFPLDEFVARDNFTAPFPEGISSLEQSTSRNGQKYLIPMQIGTMVMFYAKGPFDEAGIPYPTDDWTFDEFLEIAEQLTDLSGSTRKYGLEANGNWFRDIGWIRGTGAQEFDELVDPRTAQFNQPEIVDILQTVAYDVFHTLRIAPTSADLSGGANAFDTGSVAMKYEGPWWFPRMNSPQLREDGAAIPFDVVLMPRMADESRPHRGWAEGIVLPRSGNEEAAWGFASFMAGEEGDRLYSEMTGRIPNSLDLIENFWIPTIQERFEVNNGQAFVQAIRNSEVDVVSGVPRSRMWAEIVRPNGYDPMLNASATAAEVLPRVDEALQALLDDYWANV
jgi:multiple sugar transport system substrate-binding protein